MGEPDVTNHGAIAQMPDLCRAPDSRPPPPAHIQMCEPDLGPGCKYLVTRILLCVKVQRLYYGQQVPAACECANA